MGSLDADTALRGDTEIAAGVRRFTATLSEDWRIWGPAGGYLASIGLRAAGAACGRARPASINAHFLSVGAFEEVEVVATVLRDTRDASVVDVMIEQGDRKLLRATVWGVDEFDGLEHHTELRPGPLPEPLSVPTVAERLADESDEPVFTFWENIESRNPHWIDDWENREPSEPARGCWYRFRPDATFDDPWVDACRSLVIVDVDAWPVTTLAHTDPIDYFAPTIEVTTRFLGDARGHEWLENWAWAPVGRDGLIGARGEVWTADHQLVAIGGSTLLCRPAARRPDQ